jgi:hypothetical protein
MLAQLIGLKVVAIKGKPADAGEKNIEPAYILFDDAKTFIQLRHQNIIDFHDFDPKAKLVDVCQSAPSWEAIKRLGPDIG